MQQSECLLIRFILPHIPRFEQGRTRLTRVPVNSREGSRGSSSTARIPASRAARTSVKSWSPMSAHASGAAPISRAMRRSPEGSGFPARGKARIPSASSSGRRRSASELEAMHRQNPAALALSTQRAAAGSGTAPRQGARVLSASRRRTRAPPRAVSGTSARRGAQKSGRRLMGSALLSLFHFT